MKRRIILYAKRPLPNHVKTRLGAVIGAEEAAGVYARLLYTCLLDLLAAKLTATEIELSLSSKADLPFFVPAFPELLVSAQLEGDLGQRMAASFERAFAEGAELAILIGSDIPGLDGQVAREAFKALAAAPVVIGPATDGGYYLIGMRAPGAALFSGVEWSSSLVLSQTQALAQEQGLEIAYLSELSDVDTGADFVRWQQELGLKVTIDSTEKRF